MVLDDDVASNEQLQLAGRCQPKRHQPNNGIPLTGSTNRRGDDVNQLLSSTTASNCFRSSANRQQATTGNASSLMWQPARRQPGSGNISSSRTLIDGAIITATGEPTFRRSSGL
jgi:hypothetical protein